MKMRISAVCLVATAAIILAGCYNSNHQNHPKGLGLLALMSPDDMVADMSQSSLDSLNEGMTDINTSGQMNLSYRIPYPGNWQDHPVLAERLRVAESIMMRPFSANAETVSCPGGGSVDVTDPSGTWNSSNGSFYVIRTFNSCTGPFGLFRVDGDAVLHWTGMNAAATGVAKLQPGSKLEQAPVNKRFTRIATGGYVTVEGNGSTLTSGSLSGSIAHTVNWITVGANSRTYQLSSDLNRKGYTPGGALVFNHHVKTPSHLDITADMTGKTWTASGTVQVDYVLVGVTVETTFSSLVIPMDDCMPLSGTANFIVSGNWTGSGTLTYNGDGTANYSYSYTNERGKTVTGSGTFAVSGCQ